MQHFPRNRITPLAATVITILCIAAAVGICLFSVNHTHPARVAVAASRLTPFQQAVLGDLHRQTALLIVYHDGYYTGGDPPAHLGVCTDVVIRSYRAAGVDLNRLVTRDVAAHPEAYGIRRPDPNIDQRRCQNLAKFFSRNAISLPTSGVHADWRAGDIVFWDTSGAATDRVARHVGVVTNDLDMQGVPTVIHHLPGHFVAEMDWLYAAPVVYHFRWPQQRQIS